MATDRNGTPRPRIIPVGGELPPMDGSATPPDGRQQHQGTNEGKPKGKRASGKARAVGERFRTLNTFVDFTAGRLRRNELLVWLVLYRDARDGIARTSQADLARRAGVSKRTVVRAVQKLVRRGLLAVVFRGGVRLGPSAYRVRPLEREGP